jgi:undecaprenyl-diphosphatase
VTLTHADLVLAEHANHFAAAHDGWEDAARGWAMVSEPVFLAGVLLLIAAGLLARRGGLVAAGVEAIAASGASLIVAAVVAHLVARPRPFVAHPEIHAFLAHAPDPGFPSDHATAAFAIATTLILRFGLRATPVLLAAVALAASRVLVGVHYPGDVIAGALIGTVCALGVHVAASSLRDWSRLVTVRNATSTRLHARKT